MVERVRFNAPSGNHAQFIYIVLYSSLYAAHVTYMVTLAFWTLLQVCSGGMRKQLPQLLQTTEEILITYYTEFIIIIIHSFLWEQIQTMLYMKNAPSEAILKCSFSVTQLKYFPIQALTVLTLPCCFLLRRTQCDQECSLITGFVFTGWCLQNLHLRASWWWVQSFDTVEGRRLKLARPALL